MASNCKYCGQMINWQQANGRFTPLNLDGSKHNCPNRPQAQPQQTQNADSHRSIVQIESAINNIVVTQAEILRKMAHLEAMLLTMQPHKPIDQFTLQAGAQTNNP